MGGSFSFGFEVGKGEGEGEGDWGWEREGGGGGLHICIVVQFFSDYVRYITYIHTQTFIIISHAMGCGEGRGGGGEGVVDVGVGCIWVWDVYILAIVEERLHFSRIYMYGSYIHQP